ncbi:hypothetical protein VM98_33675, partial [Streptomyces rubellomurinus subsp. indigoferus]
QWWERLTVVGIDLRDPRQVLGLTEQLRAEGRPPDILVNNAAQTLRPPPESYARLTTGEQAALSAADRRAITHAPGCWPSTGTAQLPAGAASWPAPVDEAGAVPDPAPASSRSAALRSPEPTRVVGVPVINSPPPARC